MAEIELICPGCGADYALPAGALPPAGREVECSRCGHVWTATPPAPEGPLDLGRYSRVAGVAPPVAGRSAQPDPDEDDRPASVPLPPASKRLSPDLLDLLRDEVDREKRLREAEAGDAEARGAEARGGETDCTGMGGTGTRPGTAATVPGPDDNGISHLSASEDEIDWPATTVTLPAGSSRSMTPMAQPPVLLTPAAEPMPVQATLAAPVLLTRRPQPVPARRADLSPRPAPAAIRPGPSSAPAANLRADASAPNRAPQASRRFAQTASKGPRKACRLGLGLAALLVVAIVTIYLLAPVIQPQDGAVAQTLSAWRSDLDLARLWLDGQLRRLIP